MKNENQLDTSKTVSKIPWHKTPEGRARKKELDRAYRQSSKDKNRRKEYDKTYSKRPDVKIKKHQKNKLRRQTQESKIYQHEYRQTPEYKEQQKQYRQTPDYKAKKKEWDKTYRQSTSCKKRESTPEYKAEKRKRDYKLRKKKLKKDALFKAKEKLRKSVYNALKRLSQNKTCDTQKLLGCTWIEAKQHFEKLFTEGMNWNNHGKGKGKWNIDHIRPVSSFTKKDLHLMNNICNLQPLWAEENTEKSDKMDLLS